MPARATLGGGALSLPINTGWASKNINIDDPVEVALAGRLQMSALAHVAGFTSRAYALECVYPLVRLFDETPWSSSG